MSTPVPPPAAPVPPVLALWPVWLVLLAAAGTFALTMGTRQSMGLFLGPLNTTTGLGLGQISLAFAVGQLWWGLTQPFAGAMADKVGAGRVLLVGVCLVGMLVAWCSCCSVGSRKYAANDAKNSAANRGKNLFTWAIHSS
jgi:MFS family permease